MVPKHRRLELTNECRLGNKFAESLSLAWPEQLHIDTLSEVLHRLAEDAVDQQLVEVDFKVTLCLLPEFGVFPNIGLHPWALIEDWGPAFRPRETHPHTNL